ncbi:MAG TPA: alpha/beta hydrolase-fold protein [Acidimicrobiia bacterium]|nr:alpha/beta hydrolase-fold protein [Acidimicrobiia bacterium]
MDPQNISVVGRPFLGALLAAAVGVFAASWLMRPRIIRWAIRGCALLIVVVFAAACVNSYYDYLPTLAAVMGRRAVDQMSEARFRQLEAASAAAGVHYAMGRSGRIAAGLPVAPALTRGVVIDFNMPGVYSGFNARKGQVYLPPAWFRYPRPHLPVIELLHGSPGEPADWTRAAYADVTADKYAALHDGFAPIIVMPDVNGSWWGDSECVNGLRGNVDTYLTYDVPAAIIARFSADPFGRGWAVAGLSEGGTCALMLALRHPDDFAAAADFSGDEYPSTAGGYTKLFGGTPATAARVEQTYDPRSLIASWGHRPGPALWISIGRNDQWRRLYGFARFAMRHGFSVNFVTLAGKHDFRVWTKSFNESLGWMVAKISSEVSIPSLDRRA